VDHQQGRRSRLRPDLCPSVAALPALSSSELRPGANHRPWSSLVYASAGLPQISQNDALVLAGTLHGVHAIAAQLSPVGGEGGKGEGCEIIESDGVRLIIYLTPTGPSVRSWRLTDA